MINKIANKKLYAHRGLHDKDNQIYENSLSAIKNAVDNNYGIEFDIQITKDNKPAVFHDFILERMTSYNGYVADYTMDELTKMNLGASKDTIPTLENVLEIVAGKVPLMIEIKNQGKPGKTEDLIVQMLKKYKGPFSIISFNPYILSYFSKKMPEVPRGQLSCYFTEEVFSYLNPVQKYFRKRLMLNHISNPAFISYKAETLPNKYVTKKSQKYGLPVFCWTVRSQEEYRRVKNITEGIVFENFTPKN